MGETHPGRSLGSLLLAEAKAGLLLPSVEAWLSQQFTL